MALVPGAAASPLSGEGADDTSLAGLGAEAGVLASSPLGEGADELEGDGEVVASGEEAGEGAGGDVIGSCAKTPVMATNTRARTMT